MRGPVDINLDDVLVLLEDGPHSMGQLATWLSTSVPTVKSALVRLGRAGRVRCVGPQRLWELVPASDLGPPPAAASGPTPADQGRCAQKAEVSSQKSEGSSPDITPEPDDDADADVADEFLEPVRRRPKALRQPSAAASTTQRGTAWWVGLDRAAHNAHAAAHSASMSNSREGRSLSSARGITR